MKLARKIIALLLATFLVLLITLGHFEALRAARDYQRLVATNLTTTGRSLRPAFLEVLGVEGLDRAIQVVAREDAPNMHIRWAPFDELASTNLSPAQRAALRDGEEVTGGGTPQDPKLHVYVPIPEARGAIQVSQTSTAERDVVERVVREQIALATAAVVGAALLSVLAGVFVVGRPVQALVNQARRIGAGHWSERVVVDRHDELGELAREMNGMCDELQHVQRRLEQEAEARVGAVEQLRHSERLRTVGTLASGVAHELGTPLSVISGRATMIASNLTNHADCRKNAATIVAQVNRMAHIIRGLLDFSRRGSAEKVRLDLRELAHRTVELIAPLAEKKQVDVVLDVGNQPLFAQVDVAQAEQALANLVVNGLDAMKCSGGELTLRTRKVRAHPPHGGDADYVQVVVRDRGVGISGEHLAHVFEPFFTTKDVGEGTGLGLSVTYGIMQDHAGFVDVESKLGEGSTFALYFPVAA